MHPLQIIGCLITALTIVYLWMEFVGEATLRRTRERKARAIVDAFLREGDLPHEYIPFEQSRVSHQMWERFESIKNAMAEEGFQLIADLENASLTSLISGLTGGTPSLKKAIRRNEPERSIWHKAFSLLRFIILLPIRIVVMLVELASRFVDNVKGGTQMPGGPTERLREAEAFSRFLVDPESQVVAELYFARTLNGVFASCLELITEFDDGQFFVSGNTFTPGRISHPKVRANWLEPSAAHYAVLNLHGNRIRDYLAEHEGVATVKVGESTDVVKMLVRRDRLLSESFDPSRLPMLLKQQGMDDQLIDDVKEVLAEVTRQEYS